jgi:hypothetical protein
MARRKIFIIVEATVDASATKADVEQFAIEALSTWGGQRHPDDPLFNSLEVRKLRICTDAFKQVYWR